VTDGKKTICFDLDGILCSLTDGRYENAVPNREAIQVANALHDRGCKIVIYTARFMGRNDQDVIAAYKEGYELTRRQLQKWGIRYDDLFLGKPSFDVLIDDRAVFFQHDWQKIGVACGLAAGMPGKKSHADASRHRPGRGKMESNANKTKAS
jgi:hypothetical protein